MEVAYYLFLWSKTILSNVTMFQNYAERYGIAIHTSRGNHIHLENSIVWANNDQTQTISLGNDMGNMDSVVVRNSIIRNGSQSVTQLEDGGFLNWSETNFNSDPLVDEVNNYELLSGSPAVDAGNGHVIYKDEDGSGNDIGWRGGTNLAMPVDDLDFGYVGLGYERKKENIYL